MKNKQIIGRVEEAHFKTLGLKHIDIKVDTGAYTSSIHCEKIQLIDNKLYCNFLDDTHPDYNHKQLIFERFEQKSVRSSNGQTETRFVITTEIKLGKKEYHIELTLTDRTEMKYPVLLGRRFLAGRFIVDVAKTYKLRKKPKNEKKSSDSYSIEKR